MLATIQRNAIFNWRTAMPSAKIILIGDDPGVADAAEELGCSHLGNIPVNRFGTPFLNAIFRMGQEASSTPLVCYINTDILLPDSFFSAVATVRSRFDNFLMIGRRWNANIPEKLDFGPGWNERLERIRRERGVLFTPDAIDYFIFPHGRFLDMPDFTIGRFAWDNWILRAAASTGMELVDATEAVPVIHQNHTYGHVQQAEPDGTRIQSPEIQENQRLLFDSFPDTNARNSSTCSAAWTLTPEGLKRTSIRERFRWYLLTWFHGVRLQCKDCVFRLGGERTLQKIITLKRKILPAQAAYEVVPQTMPFFIISYNRLSYLTVLIDWLEKAGHTNIIIVDNASTYPPLVKFLHESRHRVERLEKNYGHLAVWQCGRFDDILHRTLYGVSDCDIVPDEHCPFDAVAHCSRLLLRCNNLTKVGLSLRIDDIPDRYSEKKMVVAWEEQFWESRFPHEPLYDAMIDTTFAIYRPGIFPDTDDWWRSGRTSPPYTGRHLTWYEDSCSPDEETSYYRNSLNASDSHWSSDTETLRNECHKLRVKILALEQENRILRQKWSSVLYVLVRKVWRVLTGKS